MEHKQSNEEINWFDEFVKFVPSKWEADESEKCLIASMVFLLENYRLKCLISSLFDVLDLMQEFDSQHPELTDRNLN